MDLMKRFDMPHEPMEPGVLNVETVGIEMRKWKRCR